MTTESPPDCPFCRKLAWVQELPADELVWQFPHSVALLGPWQFYHGHCLLVSRRHATELNQLEDDERPVFLEEMCQLAQAIEDCFCPHKLNYELLGNQVPHLHWHLFPRYRDDPDTLKPVWLALDRADRDAAELQRLQTSPTRPYRDDSALAATAPGTLGPHSIMTPPRIGTRGSKLALWQANHVADQLRPLAAPRAVELIEIQTSGDRIQDVALSQIGGDGLFTKEIQRALLAGTVDVAVHSLKDLPTEPVAGLTLSAVPPRGPKGDAFVSKRFARFDDLPSGAVVATSSLRRRAQVLHRRPDLKLVDMRGNVETRLHKLEEQDLDAMILAEAGLVRLGLEKEITEILDRGWMLPAVGQGALGLECRTDDALTRALLEPLNDAATRQAVLAERAFLRALGGGCLVPVGTLTTVAEGTLHLRGVVLPPDGSRRLAGEVLGDPRTAEELGARLAKDLLAQGAGELLA